MERPRVWLITGASSGFGRAVTEAVLQNGEIAVATLRSPPDLAVLQEAHRPDQLFVVKCDVTNPQDIKNAFKLTIEQFGRCDVVFNNAGYAVVGELEGTPDDVARAMFEVNFWGATNLSREAVRVFRELNPKGSGGLLLNVSSGNGLVPSPTVGYYSASKHALEGFTEGLAMELDPEWNIKVSIVAPGVFRTRAHTTNGVKVPVHEAYQKPSLATTHLRTWFETLDGEWGNVELAAQKIFEFSNLESPPRRWALGKDTISTVKKKAERILKETEEFAGWSEGLYE